MSTPRLRWSTIVARLGLGLALVGAVLWVLLDGGERPAFTFVPWAAAVSLLGSAAANAVTARRWQLLSESLTATRLPYGVYFHHLATTRVLGQFLPSLVVDLVGRSAGLRSAGSADSVGRLVVPLVLERILDLVLPAVLLGWAIAVQQGALVDGAAWASLAAVLLGFGALAVPLLGPLARAALWGRSWLRARLHRDTETAIVPPVPTALAARVSALSLGRWVTAMLQYWAAGTALGAGLSPLVVNAAAPTGQLAALVGITPGALGLQEGGWAGAMTLLGADAGDIAVFILAMRGAMIVNFAVLAALSWRWRSASPP